MSEEEIIKLVRTLIGNINPVADSRIDDIARTNANKKYEVISHLIADIGCMVEENDGSHFGSVIECKENGIHILKNLKSEIEEYLSEVDYD